MDWLKRGLINFVATTYSAQGLVTKMTAVVGCYGYTLNSQFRHVNHSEISDQSERF